MAAVDARKVDRSFAATMGTDPTSRSIVQVVVTLARTLGTAAIAKGVATPAQTRALAALGCDLAQGYHFAAPVNAAAATSYLAGAAPSVVPVARSA